MDYLVNGFNATEAWQTTHPEAKRNTCWTEGYKILRKPEVAAFLKVRLERAWKTQEMLAEEALGRMAELARADLTECLTATGDLREPHEWPADVRRALKEYNADKRTVKLEGKTQALRTILQVTGKLKGEGETVDLLVAALTADLSRREGKEAK